MTDYHFGQVNNAKIDLDASNTKIDFYAEQIFLYTSDNATSPTPSRVILNDFTKSIDLNDNPGANAMDQGKAPAPGFVAIYVLSDVEGKQACLLGQAVDNAAATLTYTGNKAPTDVAYTHSRLVSVWPTDKDGKFVPGSQRDNAIYLQPMQAIPDFTDAEIKDYKSCSLTNLVPPNAKTVGGYTVATDVTDTGGYQWTLAATNTGVGEQHFESAFVFTSKDVAPTISSSFKDLLLVESQTFYYKVSSTYVGPGSVTASLFISEYTI